MNKIWDIYLRIFHWFLVSSVAFTIFIANENTELHYQTAKFITFLLIFRILWGFVGSYNAKFINFLPTPKNIKNYLAGKYTKKGHSPIGALSVFAMLGLLLLQLTLGLFTTDEILFEAPFYGFIDTNLQELFQNLHMVIGEIIVFIILFHILAIIISKIRGKNLVKDMVDGGIDFIDNQHKQLHLRAFFSAIISLSFVYLIFYINLV